MSWLDRLQQAEYISPNGNIRVGFAYEVLTHNTPRKTTAFDFPAVGGTFVQDLGVGGRRFPFRLYLHGDDYDLAADGLDRAIAQRGPGTLIHPQLGALTVVPFGEIKRRDDLVRECGQAAYEVTFYETLATLYETDEAAPVDAGEYEQAQIEEFTNATDLTGPADQARGIGFIDRLTAQAANYLRPIAGTVKDVGQQFDRVITSIETGLDVVIGQPATLAAQILHLVKLPATAARGIEQTLRGYRDLISAVIGGGYPQSGNGLQMAALYANGAVAAMADAAAAADYKTRGEATEAAAGVLDALAEVAEWHTDGQAYGQLLQLVADRAARLIVKSFDLSQERRVVLDRDRAIVDLAFEFYGDPERLDYLITTNGLTGSEILLCKRGRELVYYV